ncbi:energy transducer TonB [Leptospira biflexa]|jgi:protein TonB|uniref:Putative TonB protein n=2 Tax=Leptospira biflexa serovar Patoc TaxID=145259 RepID=B0SPI1_LEPBP|nr:energy transducer TonB [Leptospira biflexa]ABZ95391.1 TonB protein [Leptospira biflexa serovar Patoc strain 'Patoc 1 (Ames)']ABZ99087.1 Putative TonB protein [Leptospira biflexa serovar Patoc strain 'Patoc 1 (Paris)']TGM31935.1 energy transducer TonB [Leptospira biflexa]TGM37076.1 energy transducer TonB [Leptospira biflexa]TGM46621.1 energy transducer TonB [Leptospira biflexa]
MNRLLELLVQFKTSIKQNRERVFHICLVASLFVHTATYAGYRISQLRGEEVVEESTFEDVDVSFEEIPPELIGGTSSPAPIEKQEWVEGSNKDKADEPDNSDINPNQLSGNGTDKDGYLFSFNGDKMPTAIIDFDLKEYFPPQAKSANIMEKQVILLVQVNEDGSLQSAKVVSGRVGYGFEEAALKLIKRVRFSPGYVQGQPKKMAHRLPITFSLED